MLGEVSKVNVTIPYDLKMCNELYARNPKTLRYGTEAISSLSDSNGIRIHNHLVHERTLNHLDRLFPRICALIPQNIKDSSSLKGVLENGNPAAHNVYAKKNLANFSFYRAQQ